MDKFEPYDRAPTVKPGDIVYYAVNHKRRWWQFWKPREWNEMRAWRCTAVVRGEPIWKDGKA